MIVLGLCGSLGRDSYNRRLLEAAAAGLPRGVTFEVYEGLADVPPYNKDCDEDDSVPEAVRALREEIAAADAVLIATPEYNASVPGHLKNALDWASRPSIPRPNSARSRGSATAARAESCTWRPCAASLTSLPSGFGKLDVLVNNAGITGRDASLSEITDEDGESVLKLNLTATFYCCRAAIPRMREHGSGAVVNVASISGKEGNPNMIPYSVSKAGVICLTKALAKEVIDDGVRVNCVAPAVIETPLLDQLRAEAIEYMTTKIPMGRMGRAEEVAAVVHFLASDDASFVTGQCYDVSGGRATY